MNRINTTKYLLIAVFGIFIIAANSCAPKNPSADIQADTFTEQDQEPRDMAYYHFTVSRVHFLNKRFNESLTEMEVAESYDPDSAYIKYNLALMYIASGRLD